MLLGIKSRQILLGRHLWAGSLALLLIGLFHWSRPDLPVAMSLRLALGDVALVWVLILMATSSDRAVSYPGISSWKWLHQGAYLIFYLSALH